MSDIDPEAAGGFSAVAERYQRSRPSYSDTALATIVEQLALGPGRRVLDLAAGTGKMTARLVETGAQVVAVEPVAEMRAQLEALLPAVESLAGTAEAIPLPDASVDAVVVAQAFHWFDAPRALDEMARVLRPGGAVALVWNHRDDSVEWVRRLDDITGFTTRGRRRRETDWAAVVGASGRFGPVSLHRSGYVQEMDTAGLVDRVASMSFVATLEPAERDAVLEQARAVVAGFPQPFEHPYVTEVWCASRLG